MSEISKLDWGRAMQGNLLERWPRDEMGELSRPVLFCHMHSADMEAELKINMLEAYGIPCLPVYPGDGSFGRVVLGMSGNGVDIYVPEELLQDAQALSQEDNYEEL